jgi:hypothetical protein
VLSGELYELRCTELIEHLNQWGIENDIPPGQQFTLPCAAAAHWALASFKESDSKKQKESILNAMAYIIHNFQLTVAIMTRYGSE